MINNHLDIKEAVNDHLSYSTKHDYVIIVDMHYTPELGWLMIPNTNRVTTTQNYIFHHACIMKTLSGHCPYTVIHIVSQYGLTRTSQKILYTRSQEQGCWWLCVTRKQGINLHTSIQLIKLTQTCPWLYREIILVIINSTNNRLWCTMFYSYSEERFHRMSKSVCLHEYALYQIIIDLCKIAGCACAGYARNIFPTTDFKGNRQIAIPACITAHVWRTCRDACRDR